jgi:hypothetical protein
MSTWERQEMLTLKTVLETNGSTGIWICQKMLLQYMTCPIFLHGAKSMDIYKQVKSSGDEVL